MSHELEVTDPSKAAPIHEPGLDELNKLEALAMDLADALEQWHNDHPHTACERSLTQAHAGATSTLAWLRHAKDGRGRLLETGNGKVRRVEGARRG